MGDGRECGASTQLKSADKDMMTYDNPDPGCYIDESAGRADTVNRRTIGFAQGYGFKCGDTFEGCFCGTRGLVVEMSEEEALSVSHQGQCDEDVEELTKQPHIAAQLDAIGAEKIRTALKDYGAWDADELADDEQNKRRAVWQAGCDIKGNLSQTLSELADEAVSYLNDLETREGYAWGFEDNSLFLTHEEEQS